MGSAIWVCCVGDCPDGILPLLQRELTVIFSGARLRRTDPVRFDVPGGAYSAERRQFYSSAILADLAGRLGRKYRPLLAVTNVDLFVPGLNFVFGEADPASGVCIISLFRLRWGLPRGKAGETGFRDRVVKEAVHELGHVFGLGHCSNPRCVMYFSNSLADTDRKGKSFCPKCRSKLKLR